MPLTPRRRFLVRAALVLLAAGGIAGGLVLLAVYPPTPTAFYPKCLSYQLTGLHCPGCGLTRAVHAALNGRFADALSQNVLVVVAAPLLLGSVVRGLWRYLWQTPPRPQQWRLPVWLNVLLIALVLAFTVARNIPAYPFTLLAPHELAADD